MTRAELCAKREETLAAYGKIGKVTYCEPYGNGHINDTFLTVTENGKRYILQRINHFIFTKPQEIMANIVAVTEHIRKKSLHLGNTVKHTVISAIDTVFGKALFTRSRL